MLEHDPSWRLLWQFWKGLFLLFLITSTCVDMCIRVLELQLWIALSHPMWILGKEIQLGFPESGVGLHALNRRPIPLALTVAVSPLFMLSYYLLYRTKPILNAEWRCLRIHWKSLNNKEEDTLYFNSNISWNTVALRY